jgi:hypothetical protein
MYHMGHPGVIHGMHVLHMLSLRLARLATRGSSHQLVHGMRHAPAAGCRRLQEWRTAGVQWTTPGQAASHGISCMPGSDLLMQPWQSVSTLYERSKRHSCQAHHKGRLLKPIINVFIAASSRVFNPNCFLGSQHKQTETCRCPLRQNNAPLVNGRHGRLLTGQQTDSCRQDASTSTCSYISTIIGPCFAWCSYATAAMPVVSTWWPKRGQPQLARAS